MASVRDRIETEVKALLKDGEALLDATTKKGQADFVLGYQRWYTRALAAVRSLIPDREADFRRIYDRDEKRKTLTRTTYVLEDYLQGIGSGTDPLGTKHFDMHDVAGLKFHNQLTILESSASRLSDILANIRGVLQADLFDSELDAARELLRNSYTRASGALAGVTLEAHLAQVCVNHSVVVSKKDPSISDFNEALKGGAILDLPQWRWIQRLADIRNLCDHKKSRDPTPDEVDELVTGVDKAIKTLA